MPRHSIKDHLDHAHHLSPRLADELKKLPELNVGENRVVLKALANILQMYEDAPTRFESMFDAMMTIGLPAHRTYCSPLQAFFWLMQDDKIQVSKKLLGLDMIPSFIPGQADGPGRHSPPTSMNQKSGPSFNLDHLLDAAWNDETTLLNDSDIQHIIGRIQFSAESNEYALHAKRRSHLQIQSNILDDFLTKRDMFHPNDWGIIQTALDHSRWKQFYTVADRLNAPELISYYINKFFVFCRIPAHGVYFSFFNQEAQCTDAAYFAEFMLKRSGYQTFMRSVKWNEHPWDGMHTGSGIIMDDGRYLLVSNFNGVNLLEGPYTDIDEVDRVMSCGRKIIDQKWGAYYPPRYY